jgi:hypothetical protein
MWWNAAGMVIGKEEAALPTMNKSERIAGVSSALRSHG